MKLHDVGLWIKIIKSYDFNDNLIFEKILYDKSANFQNIDWLGAGYFILYHGQDRLLSSTLDADKNGTSIIIHARKPLIRKYHYKIGPKTKIRTVVKKALKRWIKEIETKPTEIKGFSEYKIKHSKRLSSLIKNNL